jgi:hypothetical protein
MAKPEVRIIGAIPGTQSLRPILEEFQAQGNGLVTAFSDQRLIAVSSLLPEEGVVECTPFGDVISRFMAVHGELAPAIAQKGHVQAAIAEACKALTEESPLYASGGYPGLHKRLAHTLEELRDWGFTGGELRDLASEAKEPLKAKLLSLALVEDQVQEMLSQLGPSINADRIRECMEIKPQGGAKIARLLILAGSDYQPLQLDWVKWAASHGAKITLVVERSAADIESLFVDARRISVHVGGEGFARGTPNALAARIFGGFTAPDSENLEIRISSAADPLAEAEWALRGCLQDLADGTPASKLAIYVRDLESYAPLIEFAAKRLNAPIRMSRRVPLLTNSFARLILAAVEFCASDDVRTLTRVLRSSYLGLGQEAQAEITGALRQAYATRSGQWSSLTEWAVISAEKHPWLLALLKWRSEQVGHPASLAGWIDRLRSMVDDVSWHEASAQGPEPTRQRDVRAQSSLQRSLAQSAAIQRLRETRPLSLVDFAKVARNLWEEADTSVPGNPAGIAVVHSAESLAEVDNLYVLGMLEGVFPRRRSEDPVLSDAERSAISLIRKYKPPLLTSHDSARAERDEFYRVCAAPTRKIVFSYPLADEERDNVPAFYLTEVQRAAGESLQKHNYPRPRLTPEVDRCIAEADVRLETAFNDDKVEPLPNVLRTEAAAESVRPPEEGPFSPQELREVLECPFRYFASTPLKLRVNRERSRWASLRKLPQAVQLPRQQTPEAARQALIAALHTELDRLYAEASSYELALLEAGGKRIIEDWINREFASRDIWPKDEGTVKANTVFGDEPLSGELPLWGKRLQLQGYVTATASMKDYAVATTTERRRPKEDPDSKEISDLDKLEMGLYLLAMHGKRRGVALETESMHGERALYVLPRLNTTPLESRRQDGLRVVDLGEPSDFYKVVKQKLKEALRRMQKPEVEALADEHCRWCDYGELCRRHIDFGEDRDPFGGHADTDEL